MIELILVSVVAFVSGFVTGLLAVGKMVSDERSKRGR